MGKTIRSYDHKKIADVNKRKTKGNVCNECGKSFDTRKECSAHTIGCTADNGGDIIVGGQHPGLDFDYIEYDD